MAAGGKTKPRWEISRRGFVLKRVSGGHYLAISRMGWRWGGHTATAKYPVLNGPKEKGAGYISNIGPASLPSSAFSLPGTRFVACLGQCSISANNLRLLSVIFVNSGLKIRKWISPSYCAVPGRLPLLKLLMQWTGLLKSNSTDRTIRYTAPFTLANREADYLIVWAFYKSATFSPGFSSVPDSGACK